MTGVAAEQFENYRGYHVDLRHVPGLGWIVQWSDPLTERRRSHEAGCPTPGAAAAFGPRKGWS